ADLGADPVFGDGRDAVQVEHTDQLALNLRLQLEIAIGASRGHGRSRSAHRQGAIRSHWVSLDLLLVRWMRLQLYPVTEVQYVHGYSDREADRLADQANTLSDLLHHDTVYPPGSLVLECGCGTGAQTVILAARNPGARIVAVDISAASLEQARARISAAGLRNVEFRTANVFDLPVGKERFDHVFLCFLLEHVAEPAAAPQYPEGGLRRRAA